MTFRNATERAMHLVRYRWHLQGILQALRAMEDASDREASR